MKDKAKVREDMARPTGAAFRVPYHPEVSAHRMREAAEIWAERDAAAAAARADARRSEAEGIERGRAALRDLLGGEVAFDLWRLKQELRREAHASVVPPDGDDRDSRLRRQAKRIKSFLADHKFDPKIVDRDTSLIFRGLPSFFHDRWDGVITIKDLPGATPVAANPRQNPWVTVTPPFTGWQVGLDHGAITGGFTTGRTALLDPAAGQVGNIVTLECGDASDFDCGSVTADTQVAFWYHAPVAGLVETIVAAQCGDAHHFLDIRDEWGVSDARASQRNFFMTHVIHPNVLAPSFVLASELVYDDDTSTWRDERHVQPGQPIEARFVSSGPVAAGDWVVIRAGCRNQDGAITNDMEVHSTSTFSWFLSRIHVHILE